MSAIVSPERQASQHDTIKQKVVRDFDGVNLRAVRESIGDNEFAWLENAQPIGPGNLRVTPNMSANLKTIAGQTVVAAWAIEISGTPYTFLKMSSGHLYRVLMGNPYTATQITATSGPIFTGTTAMASWKDSGVLIVDSNAGYYDYNVFSPNTLTAISNTLVSITVTDPGSGYTSSPTVNIGGPGAGATANAYVGVGSCVVAAGGANYTVGDVLTLSIGGISVLELATIKVTTVSATGAVTGVVINTNGAVLGGVGASPITTTGGAGNGATFTVTYGVYRVVVATVGTGYTGAPAISFTGGGPPTRGAAANSTVSGSLLGTTIATYAGRAWIGNGRSVSFTDVDVWNSFGGAGGSFVITDETLSGSITDLIAANSFLYIFGNESIDILGDVQVSGGETSFTRQNVTASIGTPFAASVFAFYRSLAFATTGGFYSLSGSTPQKLSANLDRLFPFINFGSPITGGQVLVNGILCQAFCFNFTDVFTLGGTARPIVAVLSEGKWFFANPGTTAVLVTVTRSVNQPIMYVWSQSGSDTVLNTLFLGTSTPQAVLIQTKLWDCDSPMVAKRPLNAAVGINWNGQINTSATVSIFTENEYSSAGALVKTLLPADMPTDFSYTLTVGPGITGGGNNIGVTIRGNMHEIIFALIAFSYQEGAPVL